MVRIRFVSGHFPVCRRMVFFFSAAYVIGIGKSFGKLLVSIMLDARKVYAVVVSHEETGELSPAAVSYTSGFYQIPGLLKWHFFLIILYFCKNFEIASFFFLYLISVIGISSRDAAFSDKNIHVSFLRTVPPYYHQADVWLEMLDHFGWTKVYRKKINKNIWCQSLSSEFSSSLLFIFSSHFFCSPLNFPQFGVLLSVRPLSILFSLSRNLVCFRQYCVFHSFFVHFESLFGNIVIFRSIIRPKFLLLLTLEFIRLFTPHHPFRRKAAFFLPLFLIILI